MDDVKQKVFIVDDEPANVLIIETAVETLGTVISTSESHRAIKLIEQHRPDVEGGWRSARIDDGRGGVAPADARQA